MINFDTSYLSEFVTDEEIEGFQTKINEIHDALHFVSENENDFKGWLDLPIKINTQELEKIKSSAKKNRRKFRYFCCNWNWWIIFGSESCDRVFEISKL